ncbi:MAG: phenylacetic acid degradation bifunctional protein PaaZ [Bacteroidetes bacterium]|nr:phenylacetic acid degradation bifunctional protein PaaZ [Bacteroidota bacterium]
MILTSFAYGQWVAGSGTPAVLRHAVTGEPIFHADSTGIDFRQMLEYGRRAGSARIRSSTFHQRALMLKELAKHLTSVKEELYRLSYCTGATKADAWFDIDGGIGTLFAYASKGRKELPNQSVYIDGATEALSKGGTFVGRHICVPLEGVAVHINAFNFPVWGMLEKFAPAFLAGMPCIIKPATSTSYVAQRAVQEIIASGILPEGSLQIICGSTGDLLDHLTLQDVVTFTGSHATGTKLRRHPRIMDESVRFTMEADSLNCCVLGEDAVPGTEEFDLFVKEVARELTTKAGQRCTAIRRIIVPERVVGDVITAVSKRLTNVPVGDPALEDVRMGPLVGREQKEEVAGRVAELRRSCETAFEYANEFRRGDAAMTDDAFFRPTLLHCAAPGSVTEPHQVEAFGPVSTVMGYRSMDDAIDLVRRGRGSLVGSFFSNNDAACRTFALGIAPYHGRIMMVNRTSAKESTGHGSPMPQMVHGGPGRAGGGEELGGIRSVMHYMQRTALQGSPTTLGAVYGEYTVGGATHTDGVHPFRKYFEDLTIGDSILTGTRTITLEDVERFAELSGDHFYAHMDDDLARRSIFEKRVAHGYFVLSAAAGLFVEPGFVPVMANYGLEGLRFITPVYPGDTIQVRLTVKSTRPKEGEAQGVVEWDVVVNNQHAQPVAVYTLLTLVARR